jgi:hypothetical protein
LAEYLNKKRRIKITPETNTNMDKTWNAGFSFAGITFRIISGRNMMEMMPKPPSIS